MDEARRQCRAILADVDKGIDPAAEAMKQRRSPRSQIFEIVVQDYIEKHAKRHKKSWKETERTFERCFLPQWRKFSIKSIDKQLVRDALDEILQKGRPSAANQAFACLRAFFSWAVEHDRCSASPCLTLKMPAKEQSRSRFLKNHEIRAVWIASERFLEPFGTIVRLLLLTGQRRNEVAGMRRNEIDFEDATWTIPAWRTKSAREQLVPLTPRTLDLLRAIPDTGELVFPARGAEGRSVSGFSKWKSQLDEASGVSDWVLHDIRRTVATGLARLGTPLHVIRKIQNHADAIPGVGKVYNQHDYLDEAREALFKWEQELAWICVEKYESQRNAA
ncbi:site-specific integrase [Hyphomicrobium sp.]|uniref:tyrosine-type recombinase/integrase n=1 Tax=Hyphomicrobium sp. TaxID=82 RepID=UPI001E0E3E2E|nr:site-specific integrase [Hyphomicrobium sp.]MBY0560272.1 tyrosine-type recombinase/integrase [Hyphomicrobium sp.]